MARLPASYRCSHERSIGTMESFPWRRVLVLGIGGLAGIAMVLAWFIGVSPRVNADTSGSSDPQDPAITLVSSSVAPPTEAQCHARGRRCFNPAAMAGSYDYAGLHAGGIDGRGT